METYLITGGTGSLGTALTHRLLKRGDVKVRVYARNEHSHEKLEASIDGLNRARLSSFVGDVRDVDRLKRAMRDVDYVIHAAAMKIIPLAAYNPRECILTNIHGTLNVIEACLDRNVKKAILVSTDKASAPTTLYGSTKHCAESTWLAANRYCGADKGKFVAARWGNVWGSAGSVLHVFLRQAKEGKFTITDKRCTRFHITMDQACDFLLHGLKAGAAGELWVPRIPSYRVVDLAEAIKPENEIVYTGLRPGEKVHESMVSKPESAFAEAFDSGYILTPDNAKNPDEFEYSSGSNPWRLGVPALKDEVAKWLGR